MSPAAIRLTDELLAAIAQMSAVYSEGNVIPWGRARARGKVIAAAEKLAAEKAKPVSEVIAPWSYWNRRGH